jgi:hypothetical protein
LYRFILEPLHDSFRISFKQINLLTNIIKYVYLYYFFNKSFHKYKFGITKGLLIRNSINYDKHEVLFPKTSYLNISVLEFTFLSNIDMNTDQQNKIKDYVNKNLKFSSVDTEENLDKFLSSDFIFYF